MSPVSLSLLQTVTLTDSSVYVRVGRHGWSTHGDAGLTVKTTNNHCSVGYTGICDCHLSFIKDIYYIYIYTCRPEQSTKKFFNLIDTESRLNMATVTRPRPRSGYITCAIVTHCTCCM